MKRDVSERTIQPVEILLTVFIHPIGMEPQRPSVRYAPQSIRAGLGQCPADARHQTTLHMVPLCQRPVFRTTGIKRLKVKMTMAIKPYWSLRQAQYTTWHPANPQ